MANVKKVIRPKVILSMDFGQGEQEVSLKFSLNAFALMEERYGSVNEAMEAIKGQSIVAVQFMLWAGLQHNFPNMTEAQVGEAIDIRDLEYYMDKVSEAMDQDKPEEENEVPNALKPV